MPVNRAAGFVSGGLLGGWLAWSGVGLGAFGDSRGIWGWLWFSCGVVQFGVGGLISVFRGFFASIGGVFILAGGLGAGIILWGLDTFLLFPNFL